MWAESHIEVNIECHKMGNRAHISPSLKVNLPPNVPITECHCDNLPPLYMKVRLRNAAEFEYGPQGPHETLSEHPQFSYYQFTKYHYDKPPIIVQDNM